MNRQRNPAVAGTFYEADPVILARSVDAMLAAVNTTAPVPKAIIAPHAGHIYSGPVAATAYARLRPGRERIKRVVLLGPSHRLAFRGIAATRAVSYLTPLGAIPVDAAAVQQIAALPGVGYLDQAHAEEHSLEVHLPFLQRALDSFTLVPLVIGDASPEDVARVLGSLWGGDDTLIVISSDLSHYHSYADARTRDARTAARIVAKTADLNGEDACGARPINGLLHVARQRGLAITELDVRNSGDTAGSRDRVVGYGVWVINPPTSLSLGHRQQLLHVARDAIRHRLSSRENYNIDLNLVTPLLQETRATFVTLNRQGALRGCIGSLVPQRPLIVDVANNALAAAFKDPRFQPLTVDEYRDVDIHISILSPAEALSVSDRQALIDVLRPGTDGLIIEENGHRATYLPSVWDQIGDAATFVAELRRKAGLPQDGWTPDTKVFRYQTEEFS